MKLRPLFALLLLTVAVPTGCSKSPPASPPAAASTEIDPVRGHLLHAQPKLPTIKVRIGDQELITEIASRPVEIATGMMYRTNMPENTAMLFVFGFPRQQSFYMRNCSVPLSAAYINPEGEILQIIDMKPFDENGIPSDSHYVQFVLEVPQGWFARHNIKPGAVLGTERGSLQETFFGKK